jgi:hypothetical protein
MKMIDYHVHEFGYLSNLGSRGRSFADAMWTVQTIHTFEGGHHRINGIGDFGVALGWSGIAFDRARF